MRDFSVCRGGYFDRMGDGDYGKGENRQVVNEFVFLAAE